MEVIAIESEDYDVFFKKPYHIFNTAIFNKLNAYKCEKVFHLIFKDTKVRLGIILGLNNGVLNSPFSAPFGSFQYQNEDVSIKQIDAAIIALENWATSKKIEGLKIISPPNFYNINFSTKVNNALHRANFTQVNSDINYHFLTKKLNDDYFSAIWYNANKNLKKAINANLIFEKIKNEDGEQAYEIIAQNRNQKGFPLKMTWNQVKETSNSVPIDFFIVKKDNINIASAIIFHVSEQIVQVVYWGDLMQFSEYKTMNFLSYSVFQYYRDNNIDIVDVGPSTENSIPNHGLCEFKESIGCDLSPKYSFYKNFVNHN